nr:hypothetical protein [Aliamphritea spongicola]
MAQNVKHGLAGGTFGLSVITAVPLLRVFGVARNIAPAVMVGLGVLAANAVDKGFCFCPACNRRDIADKPAVLDDDFTADSSAGAQVGFHFST